ncbi:S-adenosyl-L-methionine-dependent methyltransferase [Desarmillaria tabescens]|uniref:S-adenosyl-L-methionine-dependent methyltransferase n=1 Tax=Armillaria tabescens TaxID=1929756 RepID=A0AA39KGM7_ARMTA|nr:S-adenosyl-L-methionine-dependent methyltransferase [Desarmillaria tabescens]KAK0459600.1 S-adenosyl-L-methionine-dependent methyltransferase [Desarmillaria tabescens]
MAPTVTSTVIDDKPEIYEDNHVHDVYDQIASHFSSTRYKPWPIIANFLATIPTGWIGLDSGTGNGKYLPLPLERPGSIRTIGLDRSLPLLEIAKTAGDILGYGWRTGAFDYAISIATIHHLATSERRQMAVQRLLEAVSASHGRVLIYVWAIEQDELSKRTVPTSSHSSQNGQDVLVPWVLNQPSRESPQSGRVLQRYYHMFAQNELPGLVVKCAEQMELCVGPKATFGASHSGVEIIQDGWERSNYYIELRRWQS